MHVAPMLLSTQRQAATCAGHMYNTGTLNVIMESRLRSAHAEPSSCARTQALQGQLVNSGVEGCVLMSAYCCPACPAVPLLSFNDLVWPMHTWLRAVCCA